MRKTRQRALRKAVMAAIGRPPAGLRIIEADHENGIAYVPSEKRRLRKWWYKEKHNG